MLEQHKTDCYLIILFKIFEYEHIISFLKNYSIQKINFKRKLKKKRLSRLLLRQPLLF